METKTNLPAEIPVNLPTERGLTALAEKSISKLPVHLQSMVQARFKPPIRNYDAFTLATSVKDLIIVAFTELGITLEGKDDLVTFLRETLLKDLKAPKYHHLSFDLIKLFISSGIRGQYGAFKNQLNTINIQNIHHWINSGLKSDEYKRSVTEFNQKLDEEFKTSKTPVKYTKEHLKIVAIRHFEHYLETGNMPLVSGAAALAYDLIKENLKVETLIDLLDWDQIKQEAKESYDTQMRIGKGQKDLKTLILDYSLPDKDGKSGNRSFEFHVKKIGLKYYFDQLIKENKTLEFT